MFSILAFRREGDVLHFTMVAPYRDAVEQHHAAVAHRIIPCIDALLLPLVQEHGPSLRAEEVIHYLHSKVTEEGIPFASVDWLGLALFAEQRSCEAAEALARNDSPEVQERLCSTTTLAQLLWGLYEQVAQAIATTLPVKPRAA